jgi:hypothetical protein
MAFSDAFLLADQFSSRVAKVSVAGPVAFALARKAILPGVGQSTSNDERREDGEYECGLFHESITNFKPLDCRGARHVRFGSEADICGVPAHVRFTPESRHVRCVTAA